jgi:hypothetical protein
MRNTAKSVPPHAGSHQKFKRAGWRLAPVLALATAAMFASLLPAEAQRQAAPVKPAPAADGWVNYGVLKTRIADNDSTSALFVWNGDVQAPMAQNFRDAFEHVKGRVKSIELKINSGGGYNVEGEKVIQVLREIGRTHKFNTSLGPSDHCMSMCLPIYLQGQRRFAYATSVFMFHESRKVNPLTHAHYDRDRVTWVQGLVGKYFPQAGVSPAWIEVMLPKTSAATDYETGEQLWNARSGVVTCVLSAVIIDKTPAKKGAAADAPLPGVIKAGCLPPPSSVVPPAPTPAVARPQPPLAPAPVVVRPPPPQIPVPAMPTAPVAPSSTAPVTATPNIPANLPKNWTETAPAQRPATSMPSPFG